MFRRFVEFVSVYEPEYSRKIRGATPQEIDRLELQVGRRLPRTYREFLEGLGQDLGSVTTSETELDIALPLGFYKKGPGAAPRDYLFIGVHGTEPAADYFIETAEEDEARQRIMLVARGEPITRRSATPIYPSLWDMLFSHAFANKRLAKLPCQTRLRPRMVMGTQETVLAPGAALARIEPTALKLGFQRVQGTSALCPMFERKDAAILGHQNPTPGGGFSVEIGAEEERMLKKLAELFRDSGALG
jgi:hypothetical protein